MSTIPPEIFIAAQPHVDPARSAEYFVEEVPLGPIHRSLPGPVSVAAHLWCIDMPDAEAIMERHEQQLAAGTYQSDARAVISVFVRQGADGKYALDGVMYEDIMDERPDDWQG